MNVNTSFPSRRSARGVAHTLVLVCVTALAGRGGVRADSIINSRHDLSVGGPGTIKAASETEVCIFCHTPHKAAPLTPLWNHQMSVATYTPYSSSTLKATVGQPTGASKLCLSCHDGTVALGLVNSRSAPVAMANSVTVMPAGKSNLGTDLSGDHPISFNYDAALVAANGKLKDPTTLQEQVKLDHNGQLQCTSCHSPHDNQYGKFLVVDNTGSALCVKCHDEPGWPGAAHHVSTVPIPSPAAADSPTVGTGGCGNCHVPHQSPSLARLLKAATEDQTCYTCHGGQQTALNIQAEFNKASAHPVRITQQLHDPMEDAINPARHAACADCHNTHFATGAPAAAPNAGGPVQGTKGVNAAGAIVNPIAKEFELCFRCHADSVARGPARVNRQFPQTNTRVEFNPANASLHPVEAIGKSRSVPSLIAPLTVNSFIKCTDCHNNSQGRGAGGTGPNGPHGSAYTPILERNLTLVDYRTESAAEYALCYKCHDRNNLLNNASFKHHKKHIADKKTACTTCHDPHGVTLKPHLINFNANYVTSSSNGRLEFVDTGTRTGNCSLTCHGKDHKALSYKP